MSCDQFGIVYLDVTCDGNACVCICVCMYALTVLTRA